MAKLYIVVTKPNGVIVPIKEVQNFTNTGTFTINPTTFNITSRDYYFKEGDKLGLAIKFDPTLGAFQNNAKINNISLTLDSSITTTIPNFPNPYDFVVIEPGYTEDFTNNDWNALLGNANINRISQYYLDVDYNNNITVSSSLLPINFEQIVNRTATKAQVQDYYYNLKRHTLPRYDGSKTTAAKFNEYTNEPIYDENGKFISNADTGYGKEIVAGNLKPFIGYYTSKGGSTPEVLRKTIVNLDYIIDEDINIQVPALSDFTYNNQIQLFERGTYLYLDPDKNSIGQPFAGNPKYKIYRSGEYATPILYSQTGSSTGFLETLTFLPTGVEIIPQFLSAKYVSNTLSLSNAIKNALYWRSNSSLYPTDGFYGYNNFIGSWPGSNPNPVASYYEPDPVKPVPNFTYPHTWNQIPFVAGEKIYSADDNIELLFVANSRGSFYLPSPSDTPEISCKAKFTIKIKWAPTLVNTTLSDPTSVNYKLNISLPQANSKRIINPQSNPLAVGFRIMGQSTGGWNFTQITSNQTYTLSPGEERTITIETDILPRDIGYVFVQGYTFVPNDYLEPAFFDSNLDVFQFQYFTTTAQNRLNWHNASFTVLSSQLEFIQVPETNEVEINYTSNTPYITQVVNSSDTITPEGDSSLAFIQFTSSFAPALGLIYPQIPDSGYDSTIYPFQFPDNYQINPETFVAWLAGGASAFGTDVVAGLYPSSPPPLGTFDYEIRFNADENQAYPIVGYYYDNSNLVLAILRPRTAILTSNTASPPGPIPIENYQSFLIRRWIPRAGYIYLDVDAPLGKGIIKPEFITKGIQDKISEIIKELTDKGLIQ